MNTKKLLEERQAANAEGITALADRGFGLMSPLEMLKLRLDLVTDKCFPDGSTDRVQLELEWEDAVSKLVEAATELADEASKPQLDTPNSGLVLP